MLSNAKSTFIGLNTQLLFGVVMFVNFIAYYFIFDANTSYNVTGLYLRVVGIVLCVILIFLNLTNLVKQNQLFWHLTLTYCLPFFFTTMTFLNHISTVWLMNSVSATFFMLILLDIRSFTKLLFVGVASGILVSYFILEVNIEYIPGTLTFKDFVATYAAVIIIGGLFAFNRDIIALEQQNFAKKINDLNKSLEQKVKERTVELERALAAKSEFLNNMSHEIRTPVSGFTIISEGLVDNWDILSEEKKIKYANDISDSAKRLGSLISNILDLSTFITNKMYLNFRRFNFVELINEVIEEIKILYKDEQEINISLKSQKEFYITADKEWISQVLRHLLSNAIKFSKEKVNITLILDKQDHSLHFVIADTGVGVPESEMKEIFTPFTQSSRTKTRAGGRGLGLAICKEIVEAHKGKIWVENNIKQGATFHFIIPINEE